jgi:hypothetical protein
MDSSVVLNVVTTAIAVVAVVTSIVFGTAGPHREARQPHIGADRPAQGG